MTTSATTTVAGGGGEVGPADPARWRAAAASSGCGFRRSLRSGALSQPSDQPPAPTPVLLAGLPLPLRRSSPRLLVPSPAAFASIPAERNGLPLQDFGGRILL
ncbi:hypothetical protein OsI_06864 [Oryza sativa Indica Group]|uniref:Uncharacterized protein n=1 Tax=Oryza sativa subsp. indica TaxID=39946 RepID=B8AFX6_ORYSI|nr:hypothetical protein OsI_06864 [Oryza sativa Indica Group]